MTDDDPKCAFDDDEDFDVPGYMLAVQANIAEFGVHIQGVGLSSDTGPTFCYTVGLTGKGHPEILVFSLPPRVSQQILNQLCAWIFETGNMFDMGMYTPDTLLANNACCLVPMDEDDIVTYMSVARRQYGYDDGDVKACQLVWPDKDGYFPWEDSYSIDQRLQPILGGDWVAVNL